MMSAGEARASSFAAALATLDASRVPYVVQRGYLTWPEVSGDLDILVNRPNLFRAANAVREQWRRDGWDVVVLCRHVDVPVVFAGRIAYPAMIEIDLAAETSWAGGSFLDLDRVLRERIGPSPVWRARAGDESALIGVPSLLGTPDVIQRKGKVRFDRVRSLVVSDPHGAEVAWQEALGPRLSKRMLDYIVAGDLTRIVQDARGVRRRAFTRRAFVQPVALCRRARFLLRRSGTAQCGIWSATTRSLIGIREIDADPARWSARLTTIAQSHDA
jgi:hypothetical protein